VHDVDLVVKSGSLSAREERKVACPAGSLLASMSRSRRVDTGPEWKNDAYTE
jgi:hypothetical protein